jgi:uncharacterized protein YkwD
VASVSGFELRLLGQQFAGLGTADYELAVAAGDEDEITVRILVNAEALTSTELALSYDGQRYGLQEGQHGSWPDAIGKVDHIVDADNPGRFHYVARLRPGAGMDSVSGSFELVNLVLSRRPQPSAPVVTADWPQDRIQRQWLSDWYVTLPPLSAPYGVYGTAEAAANADEIYRLLNAERSDRKLPPLTRDPHLDAVAQAHARHMAEAGFFDHPNPQGMEVFQRLDAAGAPNWWSAGENIAAGYRNAYEAHTGWMNSKGHKKNIRNKDYRYVGIGAYYAPNTQMGWYWVQVFATFDSDPAQQVWIEPAGAQTVTSSR